MTPLLSLLIIKSVLYPLYRELLPRIKVNWNYPTIMISVHKAVGGLDLGSMEYEQTVEAINLYVSLYKSTTLLANLIKDSLELIQVEVGLDCLVLELDYKKFDHLVTCGWL